MSKPRSSLIGKPDSAFRTVKGFTTAIHFGKQSKHTPGQPNHDRSKSTITVGIRDLQDLVEQKAGTGRWEGSNREVVNLGQVIGNRRDPKTGASVPTTGGTIHYSRAGAHVVPADPNPASKKGGKS